MDSYESRERAFRALQTAAERMGTNNYRSGLYRTKKGKKFVDGGYTITPEHRAVIQAAQDVIAGKITVNDAMALLHTHDVMRQRLGN